MSNINYKKMKNALSELLERYHREFRNPLTPATRQFDLIRDTIILSYKMFNRFEDLTPSECRDLMQWYNRFCVRFSGVTINGDEWALGSNWWKEALAQTSTIEADDMRVLYNRIGWDYERSVKPVYDESSTIEPFEFVRDEIDSLGKINKITTVIKMHMTSSGEFPIGSYWLHKKRGTMYQLILNEDGSSIFECVSGEGPIMTHKKVKELMIPAVGAIVHSSRGKIDWKITSVSNWVAQMKPVIARKSDPIARRAVTIDRLWKPVTK